mgnify:CR=1 FL=1
MSDGKKQKTQRGLNPSTAKKNKKEDSSVTLGKFMKAKVDALNESVKAGGMKADRVIEGSGMRRKQDFRKDVATRAARESANSEGIGNNTTNTTTSSDKRWTISEGRLIEKPSQLTWPYCDL